MNACRKILVVGFGATVSSQGCQIFLGTTHQNGQMYQKGGKYTKWPYNMPIGRKIDQIAIKYTNIFHCETLQNLPKLGFLVRKETIWRAGFSVL
jgi:hypothetical protein